MHSCTSMGFLLAYMCVCVCVMRELGRTVEIIPLQGVEFLGQSAQIYRILLETSCEIFTPFYRTVSGAFVTRLIATLKSGWRVYLWPQVTGWLPRGSPRRTLERGVALNVGRKLYFTLSCVFNQPLLFLLGQHISPCFTCQYRKSWLTFFMNNFANGPWP